MFQGKVALCVLILKTVFQIEAELTKERARHLIEFQEQALLFKEEARLELDIEKEKHQEVIQKYQQEQEDLQKKVCSPLSMPQSGDRTSCSQACLPFSSLIVRSWLPYLRSAHTDSGSEKILEANYKSTRPSSECICFLLTTPHN